MIRALIKAGEWWIDMQDQPYEVGGGLPSGQATALWVRRSTEEPDAAPLVSERRRPESRLLAWRGSRLCGWHSFRLG